MSKMSAVSKVHTHHGVSCLEKGYVHCGISLSAAVRLDVCVFRAEKTAGTLTCDILCDIDALTAAVVSLSRVAFGILVGKRSTHCRHYRR